MRGRLAVVALLFCAFGSNARAQESETSSPSLGEVARQARTQKSASKPAPLITNDNLPAASPSSILGLGDASSTKSGLTTDPAAGAGSSPAENLARLEILVNRIAAIDRPTMVKLILRGRSADFPGGREWEDRLVAAKQSYVDQGHYLIAQARDLLRTAEGMSKAHVAASDPRMKELNDKLKTFMQSAIRADSGFQAVILEGRDLAQHAEQTARPR